MPKGRPVPLPIPCGLEVLFKTIFEPTDGVCIADHAQNENGEWKPKRGKVKTRDEWLEEIDRRGGIRKLYPNAHEQDGLHFRYNPTTGCTDAEVTAHRFVLVEFDKDPAGQPIDREIQYSLIVESGLPVGSLIDTANRGLHALVRVDAPDRKEYDRRQALIWDYFKPYGVLDEQNSNPSRFSRVPGIEREVYSEDGLLLSCDCQELRDVSFGAASWEEWEKSHVKPEPQPTNPFETELGFYRQVILDKASFLKAPSPRREKLLGEWFYETDLGLIYGPRGTGKTWLVDAITVSLSQGRNLDTWAASRAVPVMYLDGEMPQDDAQKRITGLDPDQNQNLYILHHQILFDRVGRVMNLAEPMTQEIITALCVERKIKVLVLDNLSCLVSGLDESSPLDWERMQAWLLDLRRRQIAVVLVHHSGISGRQRGTTKRLDQLAWIIKIEEIELEPGQIGCRFSTTFEKKRNIKGKPEWVRNWHFVTEANGQVTNSCEEISFAAKVLQRIKDSDPLGISCSDIAKEFGSSPSQVSKTAKGLLNQKLIEVRQRRYYARGFMKI